MDGYDFEAGTLGMTNQQTTIANGQTKALCTLLDQQAATVETDRIDRPPSSLIPPLPSPPFPCHAKQL